MCPPQPAEAPTTVAAALRGGGVIVGGTTAAGCGPLGCKHRDHGRQMPARTPDAIGAHAVGPAADLLDAYALRMARVNITMPDELYRQAKSAGLNISQLAQGAVTAELTRLAKIAELDAYLAQLDAELGPTTESERSEASAWADGVLGPGQGRRSA